MVAMKCAVTWCRREGQQRARLCTHHADEFTVSPEARRVEAGVLFIVRGNGLIVAQPQISPRHDGQLLDWPPRLKTMLADFVRRISLDQKP